MKWRTEEGVGASLGGVHMKWRISEGGYASQGKAEIVLESSLSGWLWSARTSGQIGFRTIESFFRVISEHEANASQILLELLPGHKKLIERVVLRLAKKALTGKEK